MHRQAPEFTDRTNAADAAGFVMAKLAGYDLQLLDWVRLSPMTESQHKPQPGTHCPAVTLSTCWKPRDSHTTVPPRPEHMYRIKINVWQGPGYPAEECRVPAITRKPLSDVLVEVTEPS